MPACSKGPLGSFLREGGGPGWRRHAASLKACECFWAGHCGRPIHAPLRSPRLAACRPKGRKGRLAWPSPRAAPLTSSPRAASHDRQASAGWTAPAWRQPALQTAPADSVVPRTKRASGLHSSGRTTFGRAIGSSQVPAAQPDGQRRRAGHSGAPGLGTKKASAMIDNRLRSRQRPRIGRHIQQVARTLRQRKSIDDAAMWPKLIND